MSCLYSSPEVTSVELLVLKSIALKYKPWIVVVIVAWSDPVHLTRDLIAVQFDSTQIFCRPSLSTKTRSPTVQRTPPAASSHSACQNEHGFLAWLFKRNIRLSFALRSEAAQLSKAIAPN
jgi:hypothetical protein